MSTDTNRWDEIESAVLSSKAALKEATTTDEIRAIAKEIGVDTEDKSDFGKFTHKAKLVGVKFWDIAAEEKENRAAKRAEEAKEIASSAADAPAVDLWVAAIEDEESKKGSFAILDTEEEVLWANTFFKDDYTRVAGDVDSAEQSAAEKAVFLARKIQAAAKLDALRVRIHTQHPELDTESLVGRGIAGGSKVAVEVVVDEDERAHFMAQDQVDRNWKNVDLAALVK